MSTEDEEHFSADEIKVEDETILESEVEDNDPYLNYGLDELFVKEEDEELTEDEQSFNCHKYEDEKDPVEDKNMVKNREENGKHVWGSRNNQNASLNKINCRVDDEGSSMRKETAKRERKCENTQLHRENDDTVKRSERLQSRLRKRNQEKAPVNSHSSLKKRAARNANQTNNKPSKLQTKGTRSSNAKTTDVKHTNEEMTEQLSESQLRRKKKLGTLTPEEDTLLKTMWREKVRKRRQEMKAKITAAKDDDTKLQLLKVRRFDEKEREHRLEKKRDRERQRYHARSQQEKEKWLERRRLRNAEKPDNVKKVAAEKLKFKRITRAINMSEDEKHLLKLKSSMRYKEKMSNMSPEELQRRKEWKKINRINYEQKLTDEDKEIRRKKQKAWRESWDNQKRAKHRENLRKYYHEKKGALINNPQKWEQAQKKWEAMEQIRHQLGITITRWDRDKEISEEEKLRRRKEWKRVNIIMRKYMKNSDVPTNFEFDGMTFRSETCEQRENRLMRGRVNKAKQTLRKCRNAPGAPNDIVNLYIATKSEPREPIKTEPPKTLPEALLAQSVNLSNQALNDLPLPPLQLNIIPESSFHMEVFNTKLNPVDSSSITVAQDISIICPAQYNPSYPPVGTPMEYDYNYTDLTPSISEAQEYCSSETGLSHAPNCLDSDNLSNPTPTPPSPPVEVQPKKRGRNPSPKKTHDPHLPRGPLFKHVVRDATCDICGHEYTSKYLQQHKRETHNPHWKDGKCSLCNTSFPSGRTFAKHYDTVHEARTPTTRTTNDSMNKKTCICELCGCFLTAEGLRKHMYYTHGDGDNKDRWSQCPQCPKMFKRGQVLKKHRRKVHGCTELSLRFPCFRCDEKFEKEAALGKHVEDSHPDSYYACEYCHSFRYSKPSLKFHFLRCPKRPKGSSGLKQVYDKMTDVEGTERIKISCELCSNKVCLFSMERHYKEVHGLAEDIFKCFHCEKTFKRRMFLVDHMDFVHGVQVKNVLEDVAKLNVKDRFSDKIQNIFDNPPPKFHRVGRRKGVKNKKQRIKSGNICKSNAMSKLPKKRVGRKKKNMTTKGNDNDEYQSLEVETTKNTEDSKVNKGARKTITKARKFPN